MLLLLLLLLLSGLARRVSKIRVGRLAISHQDHCKLIATLLPWWRLLVKLRRCSILLLLLLRYPRWGLLL